eukprot:s114_g26.t1
MIVDLQVGAWFEDCYTNVYSRYVAGSADTTATFFKKKPNQRPDLEGAFPFYGVDEDGNFDDPPDEESLISWAANHRKQVPGQKEDIAAEFGIVQADPSIMTGDDAQMKLKAKAKAVGGLQRQSEFMRRIYKGALDAMFTRTFGQIFKMWRTSFTSRRMRSFSLLAKIQDDMLRFTWSPS